jgi:serine/threonine-protein kinase
LAEYPAGTLACPLDKATTVGTRDEAQSRSLLGKSVGTYRVTRPIARGGMGEVYEAEHPQIARRVAVKVLNAEAVQNAGYVQRFFTEARAVNVIRHRNIIEVLDLACLSDGRPYLVMEFLEGEALSARLRDAGPLPLAEIGALLLPVLDALQAAHEVGILHRDLKPDNVFLAQRRGQVEPTVLDFGIAKVTDGSGSNTTTGSVLGTPQYMAPEQARGWDIDARTDVYATGVILYEMCCGQPPFSAPSYAEVLVKHIMEEPPTPRRARKDLPGAVEAVILKALAKDPKARFDSARAMGEALRAALLAAGVPGEELPQMTRRKAAGARPAGATPTTLRAGPAARAEGSAATPAGAAGTSEEQAAAAAVRAERGEAPQSTDALRAALSSEEAAILATMRAPSQQTMQSAAAEVVPTLAPLARRGRVPWWGAVAAGAVVVAGVAVGALVLNGDGGGGKDPSGDGVRKSAGKVARAEETGAASTTPAPDTAAPHGPVTARIDTLPHGALIVRVLDGTRLGATPGSVSLPEGVDGDVEFDLVKDGFLTERVRFPAAVGGESTVKLKPGKAPRPRAGKGGKAGKGGPKGDKLDLVD